ncbi:MAG: hypothetical protein KKH88_04455 [Nanoarchaeota archaeon]|nr:hypothetical protein [Nanoarchaeota archaeon]MBU1444905.1 hypothetical protein [Nanoarchaeota archaeon]MBU2406815.1 hypothetical protein [Nanoarchaeota archaeon]MBU2420218.1 hypothetical protein [Nanoarchaeota archaeon]MBU2475222.1 hypothetical protein [Nanoarchaeota archaeon]
MEKKVLLIILLILSVSFLIVGCGNLQSCLADCRRMCNPDLECCYYDDCISSGCPGNDVSYYENKGLVNFEDVLEFNWTNCEGILPKDIGKGDDMCTVDSDCRYFGYADSCHTPEYMDGVHDRCEDGTGPCPSEAQGREGITCTCENNRCEEHEIIVEA